MQNSQDIVKSLSFGMKAADGVFSGIDKLTQAVSSTLGASGKCVILEDFMGRPTITKDGVTVANAVNLRDPLENMRRERPCLRRATEPLRLRCLRTVY